MVAARWGGEPKLDPVLVTAEKHTENVQDVPVSVTAISERIKDSGIRSIQDVARQVPNLFIANWGSGATHCTPSYAASGPSTTRPSAFMWTT